MGGGRSDRSQQVDGNQNVVLGQVDNSTIAVTFAGDAGRRLPSAAQLAELLPPLPAGFVDRSLVQDTVGAVLRVAADDARDAVVLRGAGGFGKTTAAIAVARAPEVQSAFSDGVLWVGLGPSPDVIAALRGVCGLLSTDDRPLASVDEGASRLALALSSRRILLVIDDIWDERHLAPFMLGGSQSVRLVTSRHRLRSVAAEATEQVVVREMSAAESVQLLAADEVLHAATDVEPAFRLAERLGRWPLLLRLVSRVLAEWTGDGSMSVDEALAAILEHIGDQGVTAFDDLDPQTTGRDSAVGRTLDLSLSLLPPSEQLRLFELGVLSEEPRTETSVAAALWGVSDVEARRQVVRFDALSLIDLDGSWRAFRIHRVVRELLAERLPDPQATHRRLVALWPDPFALDPVEDRYALRHLVSHLAVLGDTERLRLFTAEPWQQHLRRLTGSDIAFVSGALTTTDTLARLGLLAEAAAAKLAALNLQIAGDRLPGELVTLLVRLEDPAAATSYIDLVGDRVRRAELHVVAAEAKPAGRAIDDALDALRDVKDRWHFVVMMARLAAAAAEVSATRARELVARAQAEIAKLDSAVDRYRLGLPLAVTLARLQGEAVARAELRLAAEAVADERPSERHALASTALVDLAEHGYYWPECLPTRVETTLVDTAADKLVEARAGGSVVELLARSDLKSRRARATRAALRLVLAGLYDTAAELLALADAAPVNRRSGESWEPAAQRAIVRGAATSAGPSAGEQAACVELGRALRLAGQQPSAAARMLRDFLDWDAAAPDEWGFFVRRTTYEVALHAALDVGDLDLVQQMYSRLADDRRMLLGALHNGPKASVARDHFVGRLIEAGRELLDTSDDESDDESADDAPAPRGARWAPPGGDRVSESELHLATIRLASGEEQRQEAIAAARLYVAGLASPWWRCRLAAAVGLAAMEVGASGVASELAETAVDDLLETEDPPRAPVALARLAVAVGPAGGRTAIQHTHRLLDDALSGAQEIEQQDGRPELMDTADSLSAVAPPLQAWSSTERLLGGPRTEAMGAVAEAAARLKDYDVFGRALLAAEDPADRTTIVRTVLDAESIAPADRITLAGHVLAAKGLLDDWGWAVVCTRRAELAVADRTAAGNVRELVRLATEAMRVLSGSSLAALQWRVAGLHLDIGSTETGLELLRQWSDPEARVWRSDETLVSVTSTLSRYGHLAAATRSARLVSRSSRCPGVLASIVEHRPADHTADRPAGAGPQVDDILAEATTLASALADPWDRRSALLDVARSAFRGAHCAAATKALSLIGPVDTWADDLLCRLDQADLPAVSVDWLVETVRDESLMRLPAVDRATVAVRLALLCAASGYPDARARLRRAAGQAGVTNVSRGDPALARLVALGLAKADRVADAVAVIARLPDAQAAVLVALEVHDSLGPTPAGWRGSPLLDLAVRTTRRCEHPGVRDRLLAAAATRYYAAGSVALAIDALTAVRSHGIQVAVTRAIVESASHDRSEAGDLDRFLASMIPRVDRLDVFWVLVPALFERMPAEGRPSHVDSLLDTDAWTRLAKATAVKERRRS